MVLTSVALPLRLRLGRLKVALEKHFAILSQPVIMIKCRFRELHAQTRASVPLTIQ